MRHRPFLTRTVTSAAAVAATLALAGCSPSGSHVSDGTESTAAPTPSDADSALPLSSFLGIQAARTQTDRDLVAWTIVQQNETARCMKEQGFRYTPRIPALDDVTVTPDQRGTADFVNTYGYGITAGVGGSSTSISFPEPSEEEIAYLESLGPAEGEAWNLAMHGQVDGESDDGGDAPGPGCWEKGRLVADGELPPTSQSAAWQEAVEFIAAMPTNSAFDDINGEWSACMGRQGYTFVRPAESEAWVNEQFVEAAESPHGLTEQVLSDLQAQEVALARLDYDCREQTSWAQTTLRIQIDLERAYLDEHRSELELELAGSG